MKSWTWSTTLGSAVRLRASGQWELSRLSASRFQRSCSVHHPVRRCLPPRKIFVWRDEQQIKIQRRFNLDSVFAVRALPR